VEALLDHYVPDVIDAETGEPIPSESLDELLATPPIPWRSPSDVGAVE
jgi:hypothetical protein